MKVSQVLTILLAIVHTSFAQQPTIDSLKDELVKAKNDTIRVRLLLDLSLAYNWSYADTSIFYTQQALDLSHQLDYKRGLIRGYGRMSSALSTLGNYPLALEFAFKSLSLAEQSANNYGIAFSNLEVGMVYRELGYYKNALIYYRRALAMSKGMSPGALGTVWGTTASAYAKNNQYDSAILYARKAYEIDTRWSGLFYTLGNAYTKKHSYDSAIYFYRLGLPFAEENNVQVDLVDIYNGMAIVQMAKFAIDSAIWYSRKAIAARVGKTYPLGQLHAANTLSHIFDKQNKSDSTLKYLKISIALKDSLFDREKTIAVQMLDFNEREKKKEIEASKLESRNRIRMNAMLGSLFTLVVVAFLLLRNNRNKQIAKLKLEKSYDQLKSTQSQLISSEKMASLGELTAGIAHEIQNPLNFVNNFSEVSNELLNEMKAEIEKGNFGEAKKITDNVAQNLEKILHHGKRADGIVKSMLQHSRSSSGIKEPTDLSALADEYLRLAYHGFRAKDKSFNVTTKTDFEESIGKINVVPQDIGRVVLNLITNAFFTISEKKKQSSNEYEPTVTLKTKKQDGRVLISVIDNGNGISPKVLDKIFQPFFTTKPTGQGTGLGLSLSYDIVKAHGGKLSVETKEGEGSEFLIHLPVS